MRCRCASLGTAPASPSAAATRASSVRRPLSPRTAADSLKTVPPGEAMASVLRNIPSVTELLDSPPLKSLVNRVSRNVVVSGVRQFLDDMRTQVQSAAASIHVPTSAELAERIAQWIATDQHPSLAPVINATG